MSLEIFKPIDGYEDYEISTWGRVFNKRTGNFITPYHHHKGYMRVDLKNSKGVKHFKVHRLVAKAFIPNPENKPQVNHIDGNPGNNSVTNLEWVTNRENCDKAREIRDFAVMRHSVTQAEAEETKEQLSLFMKGTRI